MNNVIVLSFIHGKELEGNFSSFILKNELEKFKGWRRKTFESVCKQFIQVFKSNPRKDLTYKIPSEKKALILIPF